MTKQKGGFDMGRDEAATVYLEVLLGFRAEYRKFYEAAEMLTDNEKILLQNAVSGAPTKKARCSREG